jgi:hypothetical protein
VHEVRALAKTSAVARAEEPPEESERQDGEGESHEAEDEIRPARAVRVRAEAVLERPHGDEEEDCPEYRVEDGEGGAHAGVSVTQAEWAVEESNLQPWD